MKVKQVASWCLLCLGLVASLSHSMEIPPLNPETKAVMAIIIDDIGYREAEGRRAANLAHPEVALSFLPHAPSTKLLARLAKQQGKTIMMHQPMQALSKQARLGKGAIMVQTDRVAFYETVMNNLLAVPGVAGVNSHMGSLLTQHPGHMRWLMEDLRSVKRELFFVDSRTHHQSVALDIAKEQGVLAGGRDIFLDPQNDAKVIEQQWQRALRRARTQGQVLVIAHPYPATLSLLEQALPTLTDIQLVPIRFYLSLTQHIMPKANSIDQNISDKL